MSFSKELARYWILQGFILLIVVSYILGMALGMMLFINNSQPKSDNVNILLIIESSHPNYTFNYTYESRIPVNRTLLNHLNETIGRENWDGQNFGVAGWFIKRIFNATEEGSWYWGIYYRTPGTISWSPTPVGVSTFKLTQDYEIKFIFSN